MVLVSRAQEAVFWFIIGRYIPEMKPDCAVQPIISNCVYKLTFSTVLPDFMAAVILCGAGLGQTKGTSCFCFFFFFKGKTSVIKTYLPDI